MRIEEKYFYDDSLQKNNIDDVLSMDEKVLWRNKPNARSYVWANVVKMLPIGLLWLVIDTFFIVLIAHFMADGTIPLTILVFVVPFFLIHLTPVWIWIGNTVKAFKEVKNLEYAITDKRIIIRSGVIGIDFKFINYVEISSVNVKVGFIDKMFKVGDIYINAQSNSAVIWDVENPYRIGAALEKVTRDIKSDTYYPNSKRDDVNEGYATSYSKNPFEDDTF